MPLSRLQLRNEYGLGVRELYSEASKKEDPTAVLNGVAVAGLVGLLRQLGDLAEFAAEVFHGLQENITITTSRSQKLMTRVKHIEAALPPLEKAMLSQTSHIHFAYTPGTEWHPRIINEQNHFIYTDLPRCFGDFYEECKEPPRLQLLDKFDTGGLGSCLKRYSDPTFFRRASGNSSMLNDEKSKKERKARKTKKRRSSKQRSNLLSYDASNTRVQISSPPQQRQLSPAQTVSTIDMTFKSDLVDRSLSNSHGSGDGMGFIECVFRPNTSLQTDETKSKQSLSGSGDKVMNTLESKYPGKQTLISSDDSPRSSIEEKNDQRPSTDTWNEEAEHGSSSELGRQEIESTIWKSWNDEAQEVHEPAFESDEPDMEPMPRRYEVPDLLETNYDACEPDIGSVDRVSYGSAEMEEMHESSFQADELKMKPLNENHEGNEQLEVHETNLQHDERDIEESHNPRSTSFKGVHSPSFNLHKNELDEVESETDNFVDALNTIESESENDLDCRTKVDSERISDNIHGGSPSVSCDELDLCESTSVLDVPAGINFTKDYTNADGLQEESAGEQLSRECERATDFPCVSEQPFVKSSNVDPVAMWTNGILLGLQPSKPPDFSNVNKNNYISAGDLNQNLRMEDYTCANNSGCDNENGDPQQSTMVSEYHEIDSSKKLSNPVDADADHSRISAHSQSPLLHDMMHPEAKINDIVDVRDTSNEEAGFVHGLIENGFRRTRSLEHYKVPEAVGYENTRELENIPHVTMVRKEVPSPMEPAPPSPSIEHMKISFQPINSLGTSTLKLCYPEGINYFDEISDVFPSFQLIPEPTLQHDIDLDSDDDTFCRSNPCNSDDDITHLSDSNSELWESGDSSKSSRVHTRRNSLCRSSSGESLSTLAEHEKMEDRSIEDDIGSSMKPFGFQESKINFNPLAPMLPFDLGELNFEPPPLPPLQWRVSRTQSDPILGKGLGSAFPHLTKPSSEDLIHTASEHLNVTANNMHSAEQNLKATAQKKLNQAGNADRVDDRDDFLHQIRARSFNLRKTGLLKPAPTPAPPPPSVKVTAILEKAKTIRQAVASDDGEEDDPWSDT
ncbi:hypothetical protein V2J09_019492 [Rumex salicifolius]